MSACGECRFWEFAQTVDDPIPTATSPNQGACTRFGVSITTMEPRETVEVEGWETTRAYIGFDRTKTGALFMTQDDFGCNQFEARV